MLVLVLDGGSAFLDVLSSLTIILLGKREPVGLLQMCCGCLFSVPLPHGTVGWYAGF